MICTTTARSGSLSSKISASFMAIPFLFGFDGSTRLTTWSPSLSSSLKLIQTLQSYSSLRLKARSESWILNMSMRPILYFFSSIKSIFFEGSSSLLFPLYINTKIALLLVLHSFRSFRSLLCDSRDFVSSCSNRSAALIPNSRSKYSKRADSFFQWIVLVIFWKR